MRTSQAQSFHCRHGKAYLFNDVVNVKSGGGKDEDELCDIL